MLNILLTRMTVGDGKATIFCSKFWSRIQNFRVMIHEGGKVRYDRSGIVCTIYTDSSVLISYYDLVARVSALDAGYTYLLRILICSLCCIESV